MRADSPHRQALSWVAKTLRRDPTSALRQNEKNAKSFTRRGLRQPQGGATRQQATNASLEPEAFPIEASHVIQFGGDGGGTFANVFELSTRTNT